MSKIGVNERCPCGSEKKYKKCCHEKNEIKDSMNNECDKVVKLFFNYYKNEEGLEFKRTPLESPLKEHIKSIYLQCSYLKNLDKNILKVNAFDKRKQELLCRKIKLLMRLFFIPLEKRNSTGPKFIWGDIEEELTVEEYFDIIISLFSSMFEYYQWLLKDGNLFKISGSETLLKNLELKKYQGNIKPKHLKEIYQKLLKKTKENYFMNEIESFYVKEAYALRCACFHMDYSYSIEDNTFYIKINNGNSNKKITLNELRSLGTDILARVIAFFYVYHYIVSFNGFTQKKKRQNQRFTRNLAQKDSFKE